VEKFLPFSLPTADRMVNTFEELGRSYFLVRQVVKVSAKAYRLVNPEVDENGHVVIAGESYALAKKNAAAIQAAFQAAVEEKRKAKEAESHAKGEAEKARKQRDEEIAKRKKVEEAFRDAEMRKKKFWEHADEDHRFLLDLEQEIDFAFTKLRTFGKRELAADNQERYVAFCQRLWAEAHQICYYASDKYGAGLVKPDPAELVETDDLTPRKRSLVEEYRAKYPLK